MNKWHKIVGIIVFAVIGIYELLLWAFAITDWEDTPLYMGKYDYQIYHRPLSSEEQKKINESDASIVYSPFVVFEYGGGAIGSQNFVGKDEYLKKKMRLRHAYDR